MMASSISTTQLALMIIYETNYANVAYASKFLFLNSQSCDKKLSEGVKRRLKPLKSMNIDKAKKLFEVVAKSSTKLA